MLGVVQDTRGIVLGLFVFHILILALSAKENESVSISKNSSAISVCY